MPHIGIVGPLTSPYRNPDWDRLVANTASATSTATGTQVQVPHNGKPVFPLDIWTIVFQHVDHFTLWTSCRLLSHDLGAEAEREMRVSRLRDLSIEWDFATLRVPRMQNTVSDDYTLIADGISHFSEDASLVFLDLNIEEEGFGDTQLLRLSRWAKDTHERQCLLECLAYSDLNFAHRLALRNMVCPGGYTGRTRNVTVVLGPDKLNYMGVPWKDIDFDSQTISFDWRWLLDELFREEVFVQRRKRALHSDSDVGRSTYVELAEKALTIRFGGAKYITTADEETWIKDHGKEDDEVYLEAHLKRLHSCYTEAGRTFSLTECDAHISSLRRGVDAETDKVLTSDPKYPITAKDYILETIAANRENRNDWAIQDFTIERKIRRETTSQV
jgi:hypothetical protein